MTIDEITTALEEWKGGNKDKHFLLIALDDKCITARTQGNCPRLGGALASVMRAKEGTARIVQVATYLMEMNFFNDQDNDKE